MKAYEILTKLILEINEANTQLEGYLDYLGEDFNNELKSLGLGIKKVNTDDN